MKLATAADKMLAFGMFRVNAVTLAETLNHDDDEWTYRYVRRGDRFVIAVHDVDGMMFGYL